MSRDATSKERHDTRATEPVWPAQAALNPGDEVASGTPGAGENTCRDRGGSGQRAGRGGSEPCPTCNGSGRVMEMLGDA